MVTITRVLLLVVLVLSAHVSHAATIFSDNYEYPPGDVLGSGAQYDGLVAKGWDFVRPNCGGYCSMSIVPAPFGRTGTVLKYEYQSDQDLETVPAQDAHNANLIKVFSSVSELWGQVYIATDVDTIGCPTCTTSRWFCCGTKLHYIKPVGPAPSYITGYQTGEFIPTLVPLGGKPALGVQEMAVCPAGGTPVFKGGGGCNVMGQSNAQVTVYDKQWYCFVYHIKLNSSTTVSDGVIEMWINGTKIQDYQNQKMVDGYYTLANARIGQIEVYRQHSNHMIRYEDNFLLSTTALNTNCSGGTTPTTDTTPPLVPSGLQVS